MFRIIKQLTALPVGVFILFNAYVHDNIIAYHAVAPCQTAFMSMRMKQLVQGGSGVPLDYRWVSYNQISPNLKKALTASEDAKFTEHARFDWGGIRYVIKHNHKANKVRTGDSIISQRLAEDLFLNESRSYVRKGERAATMITMEVVTDKDRIFGLYLDSVEWYYGVFGAEAMAQKFFHKLAANLSRQQVASFAARIPVPLSYANNPKSKRLHVKTNIILHRMDSTELPDTEQLSGYKRQSMFCCERPSENATPKQGFRLQTAFWYFLSMQ